MKKRVVRIIVAAAVVIVIVVVAVLLSIKQPTDGPEKTNSALVGACAILTLEEARSLMGESTALASSTDAVTNESVSIDNCSYTNNAATVEDIRIVTIMTRSALDQEGREGNTAAFEVGGNANPEGAEAVSGFGDKAFWDPATSQLAILKGNVWIGIVYGGTNPANNTLDEAKKVAELVVN